MILCLMSGNGPLLNMLQFFGSKLAAHAVWLSLAIVILVQGIGLDTYVSPCTRSRSLTLSLYSSEFLQRWPTGYKGLIVVIEIRHKLNFSNSIRCTKMTISNVKRTNARQAYYQKIVTYLIMDHFLTLNTRSLLHFISLFYVSCTSHVTVVIFTVSGHVHTLCAYFYTCHDRIHAKMIDKIYKNRFL